MSSVSNGVASRKRKYDDFDTNHSADDEQQQPVSKASRTRDRPVVSGKRSTASLDACAFDETGRSVKRMCLESVTGYPTSFAYEAINRIIRAAHFARLALFARNIPPRADDGQEDMMQCVVYG